MRRELPTTFFLICLLGLLSVKLNASVVDSATVSGIIVNSDNKPVEDVQVSVLGSLTHPAYSTAQGKYEIRISSTTEVTLVFASINFNQERRTIKLHPGEHIVLNIQLHANILPEVEIKDNAILSNGTKLDAKMVEFIPSASGDFNTLLFSQPGVSSSNELSSGYSVRGGNFDENLVYVNDVEVYRPFLVRSGQQEGLSFVNPDMTSSVLFSAGGFDAMYGDKLSSVLDIQYKKPRKFNATAAASLLGGSLCLEDASKDYRFTWLLGARYKTSQYLLENTSVQGEYRPSFIDIQTYMTYDLSDVWELDFLGMYSNNRYNVVPQTSLTDFGTVNQPLQLMVYFNGQEVDLFQTGQAAVTATYHPNNRLNLKFIASAFKTSEDETFDIEGQYYINQLGTNLGSSSFGQAVNNLGVGTYIDHGRDYLTATVANLEHKGKLSIGKNSFLWGIKGQHELVTDQLSQWTYLDSAGYSLPQSSLNQIELQNVLKSQSSLTSDRISGFSQYVWKTSLKDTSNLIITGGIRANYWDVNQQTVVSPRGTAAWKPYWKKNFLFRFSAGMYYQPPFFQELIDQNGIIHTDVKAQQSTHFVLGSDYVFQLWNRPFKFTSEAYFKLLDDLNPYTINDVRIQYLANNSGYGHITGIDFKLNGEFVKGLESWFRLSLMDGSYRLKDTTLARAIPLPTNQLVNFTLFFQDYLPKFPDFKVHVSLLFGSSLPFGPPNSPVYDDVLKMPPYKRVDIGFSYQLIKESRRLPAANVFHHLKSVWLGLEVLNLLQVNNVASYSWITASNGTTYAIPNYLTTRQLNVKLIVKF